MADFVLPSDTPDPPAAAAPPDVSQAPARSLTITPGPAKPFVLPSDADAPPAAAPQTQWTAASLLKQIPVGANEAIADTLGAPVDAMNWLGRKAGLPVSNTPFAGSQSIKQGMGLIGDNPDDSPATNTGERIARGAGSGAASMLAPEALAGSLGRAGLKVAPKIADYLSGMFGSSESAGAAAANAGVGAVSGASGQAAAEAVPDKYKPAAAMAGSLIGGGVGALAAATPEAAKIGIKAAKDYIQPMTSEGQQAIAGGKLAAAASDPSAVRSALEDTPATLVPGSKPTTFQLTGDMGLGGLERQQATANPELFMQRRADQNSARVDALNNIQPTGDPAAVSKAFSDQLASADAASAAAEADARQKAEGALSNIGGTDAPDAIGSSLRGNLVDARSSAKENENALWKAVDPDGTLANSMTGIKTAAQNIYGSLPKADAANLSAPEAKLRDLVGQYNPVEPFSETASLRSNLTQAMRDELTTNGRSPAYRRLSMLNDAVQGTINNTIEGQAANEAHAVSTGAMSPEATIAARIQDWQQNFYNAKNTAANSGIGVGVSSTTGRSSPSGLYGTAGQAGGASAGVTGDAGLAQAPPLTPNFDQGAADRLKVASQATKDRAQTFDQGPVGGALRSQGAAGNYRMLDSKVPDALVQPGPAGKQVAQSYFKAVGDNPAAHADYEDAAALALRKATVKDGIVDPDKLKAATAKYDQALSVVPGLKQKFSDAATASQTLADLAAARRSNLDTIQKTAFGKIVKGDDVGKVIGNVLGSPTAPAQMRKLVQAAAQDPDASQGLRKAVADFMTSKLISNTEAATSGKNLVKNDQFQTFVRQNRPALKQVFSDQDLGTMRAIADDLHRSNRSITAVKLPGGPGTAQDIGAAKKAEPAHQGSMLTKIMAGAGAGFAAHGPVGAAAGGVAAVGQHLLGGLREAGMSKVSDLVRDAMLDPELARSLLAKAPIVPGRGSEITLAQRLKRVGMFSAANAQGQTYH